MRTLWFPIIDGFGEVKYDVGYGGGFYILADVNQLKMNFEKTPLSQLVEAGSAIKEAVGYVRTHSKSYYFTTILKVRDRINTPRKS